MISFVQFLLWSNLIATLTMCGVILFVQVVHYPLFDSWDRGRFPELERRHQRLTTWVVAPPMLVELSASLALLFVPLPGVPEYLPWVGIAFVGVWAAVTAFVSIPLHEALAARGFDAGVHRKLVRTNWLRVGAWWLHAGVGIAMLAKST